MKVKQKQEKPKGGKDNVLRGPKVPKKMKNVNKTAKKGKKTNLQIEPVKPNEPIIQGGAKNAFNVTPKMVQQGVQVLLQLHAEYRKNSKMLLLNDKENVFLQVVFMKKPDLPEKKRKYIKLHHSIYGEDPEVCLFVTDRKPYDHVKRTPDEKIEFSVDYYQEFLKKQQVEDITTVMPTFQFRTEYDSYELRRKLVDRFDLFLCQSSVLDQGSFLKNLGIAWNKKNKVPLPIKFPKKLDEFDAKFKENVAQLIKTTWFVMKPHGDTVSIRIGTLSLTAEQLTENINYVLHQIKETDVIPGGVENIKSLMLKTTRSKAVPLYINLTSRNTVPVPVVASSTVVHDAVEDELSTLPGKRVTVLPSGEVFVTRDPNQKLIPEWDEELSDGGENFFEEIKVSDKKKTPTDESDESDDDAEEAEQNYLTAWKRAADSESESENNVSSIKKKQKIVKKLGKKNEVKQKKLTKSKELIKKQSNTENLKPISPKKLKKSEKGIKVNAEKPKTQDLKKTTPKKLKKSEEGIKLNEKQTKITDLKKISPKKLKKSEKVITLNEKKTKKISPKKLKKSKGLIQEDKKKTKIQGLKELVKQDKKKPTTEGLKKKIQKQKIVKK